MYEINRQDMIDYTDKVLEFAANSESFNTDAVNKRMVKIHKKIQNSVFKDFFTVRIHNFIISINPNEEDLHRLRTLRKIISSEKKANKFISKIDYLKNCNFENKVIKNKRLNREELTIFLQLHSLKKCDDDIYLFSNITANIIEIGKKLTFEVHQGDIFTYKIKEHRNYIRDIKGTKMELYMWIEYLIKRFLFLWKYEHAGIFMLESDKLKIAHKIPNDLTGIKISPWSLSHNIFANIWRLDLNKLIERADKKEISKEEEKEFYEIFEKEMTRLCEGDFKEIRYELTNPSNLLFRHRFKSGNDKIDYSTLSIDDIRRAKNKGKAMDEFLGFTETDKLPPLSANCSEFVAYALIFSLQKVEKECKSKGFSMKYPFHEKEQLRNIHPDRLIRELKRRKLVSKVETTFNKIFNI